MVKNVMRKKEAIIYPNSKYIGSGERKVMTGQIKTFLQSNHRMTTTLNTWHTDLPYKDGNRIFLQ